MEETWDLELKPRQSLWNLNLKEIWKYKDLLILFVRRDIVAVYKQTILGPIWFFVQPLLTTIVFVVIFGNIAKIKTGQLPQVLFYLSGVVVWNYFSESLITTSKTFTENANLFGKVYFPRLIIPLSKVISGLIKFCIQFGLLAVIYLYYIIKGENVAPNLYMLLLPYLVLLMAGLGLGFGIIFSSLTTKYRDLSFLLVFGIQLLMYATPVIYPLAAIPEKYKPFIEANPLSSIIETFRFAMFNEGSFHPGGLLYSSLFSIILLLSGILIFNKIERSFIDTV